MRVVDEDDLVLRVVSDVGQLFGRQADVQGVQHRAHRRRPEVDLQVLLGVPRKGGDAVPVADAERLQRRAQPVNPSGDLAVRRAADPVVAQRDDLAVAVEAAHPLDDVLDRERMVVLHQAFEHVATPPR
jgi:hypothetical protein